MTSEQIYARGYAIPAYNIDNERLTLRYEREVFELPASSGVLEKVEWFPRFRLAPIGAVREWVKAHG